jgi:hypothetical protein
MPPEKRREAEDLHEQRIKRRKLLLGARYVMRWRIVSSYRYWCGTKRQESVNHQSAPDERLGIISR